MRAFWTGRVRTLSAAVLFGVAATSVVTAQLLLFAPPSANLDQVRNGSAASPVSPGNWVNGNAGSSQAHYLEGFSIPYRVVMEDLPVATPITLTLGYDIKHSNRHAVDYLTHFDRLEPHAFQFGHSAEVIDPLIGVSGVSMTVDTEAIPAPDTTNSPVPGQPATSFNALPSGERVMTLYGGTISGVAYAVHGDLTASQSETRISVSFTVDSSTAVLAWGGHIGSRLDWGFDGGEPRSAGGISGSPYHMRLIDWNLNNLGNQDRSLSAGAVVDPCEEVVCPGPSNDCDGGQSCDPATGDCVDLPDPAAGTACEADGSLCTADECDGNGMCLTVGTTVCPGPTGPCDGGTECDDETGGCVPVTDPPLSTPCQADASQCTLDHCDGMGNCVFMSNVSCPASTQCATIACNPMTGSCDSTPRPLSTGCEADGDLCTTDHCDGMGNCVQLDVTECQPPVPPCEGGQMCNPGTGQCEDQPDAVLSTPCQRDANQCTIDHCDGFGECVTYDNVMCSGSANPCDAGEQCDPATGLCVMLMDPPVDTPCEADGDLCTLDRCDGAGNCVFEEDVACPAGGQCTDVACDPMTGNCEVTFKALSTFCEADGDLCTNDHCDGMGNCVFLDRVTCPDGGQCRVNACNPTSGACEASDRPFSTVCEADGDLCTNDHCDGFGNCVLLSLVQCQPATQCDGGSTCDPMSGGCVMNPDPPLSTFCEADGNLCTDDHCDGMGNCVLLSNRTCPASVGECDGGAVCDPGSGLCVDLADDPLSTECELDGDLCTIDHCDGFGACVPLDVVDCSGLVDQCNDAECDPGTGDCEVMPKPLSTPCERDNNLCTNDHCDGQGGCVLLGIVDCEDPAPPCEGGQACDPGDGMCVDLPDAPDGTPCPDGAYCNGEETCLAAVCTPGDPPCDDADDCTADSCDEDLDQCHNDCPTPGITCPGDRTFECDAVGDFGDPTVDDDCSANPTFQCTEESVPGKLPQEETITRTCTTTNDCGVQSSCQHTIQIEKTLPLIGSPPTEGRLLVRQLFNRFAEVENAGGDPDREAVQPAQMAVRTLIDALKA